MRIRRRIGRLTTAWGITFAACAVAAPAAGQTVAVTVSIAADTARPLVDGTFVLALDSVGTVRASGATVDGRTRLALPWPGRWTIRAEHLGFGTATTEVEVVEGPATEVTIELHPAPILLDQLEASTESMCGPESRAPGLVELWTTARAVLTSAAGGQAAIDSAAGLRFQVATQLLKMESGAYYHKEALRDGQEEYDRAPDVKRDTVWVEGPTPFPTQDPERILAEGFILPSYPEAEEIYLYDFHAPHPELILSDDFIATHCFRFERDPTSPHMVGLAFEPNRARILEYDVSGVLWLPESADSWPWVDFRWTRIPEEGRIRDYAFQPFVKGGMREASPLLATIAENDERFGGRLDLAHVRDVGWVVNRLELRTPAVRKTWMAHLKADAVHKARTPDRILPRDVTRSLWWQLYQVHELVAEVVSVQVRERLYPP